MHIILLLNDSPGRCLHLRFVHKRTIWLSDLAENGAIRLGVSNVRATLSYLNMSSQASWRPNLSESQLFDEKTWLQGAILSAVAYGVTLALFILIIPLFITRLKVDIKHDGRASLQTTCLLTYVCVMFILSTLGMASQAGMTQLSFIENRNFPGGPAAYEEIMFSIPINNLGNICNTMTSWFSDSLLLWRCWVIYRSSRPSVWLVMAIPGLMLLASFVTGTIFLERVSRASSSPWGNTTFPFNLIYPIITLSINIVLSLMIIIRLYLYRRHFTKLLGRRYAARYTSIISILIESAAVLVVMALWFLIPFVMGNQLANIPMVSVAQVQTAASYMVIFRVTKGTAWTSQTASSEFTISDMPEHQGTLSNIRFQTDSVEYPANSPPQNKFPLDGPSDVLDSNRGSIPFMKVHIETQKFEKADLTQIEVFNTEEDVAKYI